MSNNPASAVHVIWYGIIMLLFSAAETSRWCCSAKIHIESGVVICAKLKGERGGNRLQQRRSDANESDREGGNRKETIKDDKRQQRRRDCVGVSQNRVLGQSHTDTLAAW